MVDFSKGFGNGLRGFRKTNIGGRKLLWGNFSKNLERVCVDFQKAMLAAGNYGGFLQEIWRGFEWISKKQYWREDLRGFPKSNI